jgi:hypothetical protein
MFFLVLVFSASMGISMISLYTKVPTTRMIKPKSYPTRNYSLPIAINTSQTHIVLQVSIVDRCAEDAYLVIMTPVELKTAIESTLQTE